jgi:hypothetical protein
LSGVVWPLPYLGAAANAPRVASGPALRDPRPSGSLVAGYLAPLGWLGHVLRPGGSPSLGSQSRARCFASLTPGGSLSAGCLRFAPARRAPPRLRHMAVGAGVDLSVDRIDGNCGLPWGMAWFVQRRWSQRWIRVSTWLRDVAKRSRLRAMMRWGLVLQGLGGEARRALKVDWGSLFS